MAGHRHLGSSESLQELGEQTYSTWPGSVLSLYVNFLRINQMTVFFVFFLWPDIKRQWSRTVSHKRISWGRLIMKFEFIYSRVPERHWLCVAARMTTMFFHKEEGKGQSEFLLLPMKAKLASNGKRHEGEEQRAEFGSFLWGHMVFWGCCDFFSLRGDWELLLA